MQITIDAAGRMVIPQALRRRLGLVAGTELDVQEIDGGVFLRPVSRVQVEIADDGLPVVHAPDAPPMTTDDVRALIDEASEWPRR